MRRRNDIFKNLNTIEEIGLKLYEESLNSDNEFYSDEDLILELIKIRKDVYEDFKGSDLYSSEDIRKEILKRFKVNYTDNMRFEDLRIYITCKTNHKKESAIIIENGVEKEEYSKKDKKINYNITIGNIKTHETYNINIENKEYYDKFIKFIKEKISKYDTLEKLLKEPKVIKLLKK